MDQVCYIYTSLRLTNNSTGQIDAATVKAAHFGGFSDDEEDEDGVCITNPMFFHSKHSLASTQKDKRRSNG